MDFPGCFLFPSPDDSNSTFSMSQFSPSAKWGSIVSAQMLWDASNFFKSPYFPEVK